MQIARLSTALVLVLVSLTTVREAGAVCEENPLEVMAKAYRVGGECVPVEYDPSTGLASPVIVGKDDSSAVYNLGAGPGGSEGFVCPLENNRERRGGLGTHQLCGDEARVYVIDQNTMLDVQCWLRAVDPYGLTFSSSLPELSSGASAVAQGLTFNLFSPTEDHWYVYCEVPNQEVDPFTGLGGGYSGISGYFIHEADNELLTVEYPKWP